MKSDVEYIDENKKGFTLKKLSDKKRENWKTSEKEEILNYYGWLFFWFLDWQCLILHQMIFLSYSYSYMKS